jgi:hypothetical protein
MEIRERSMTSLPRTTGDIFCKASENNVTDIEETTTCLLECRHYRLSSGMGWGLILQFAINADMLIF